MSVHTAAIHSWSRRRLLLAACAGLLACIALQAASAKSLTIGVEGTLPPFNYRDEDGELQGFEVDLMRELAQRLGAQTRWVTMPWPSLPGALRTGRVDLVIDHIVPTPERSRLLAFTRPYSQTGLAIVFCASQLGNIHGVEDLAGLRVGTSVGSYYEQWLQPRQPRATIILHPSLELGLIELRVGRIDAMLVDEIVALDLQRRSLGLQIVQLPTRDLVESIALRLNRPQLLRQLDAAIAAMLEDGSLTLLSMRWFGRDISPPR